MKLSLPQPCPGTDWECPTPQHGAHGASDTSVFLISISLQILLIQLIPLILGNYRNNCYFPIDTGLPLETEKKKNKAKKKKINEALFKKSQNKLFPSPHLQLTSEHNTVGGGSWEKYGFIVILPPLEWKERCRWMRRGSRRSLQVAAAPCPPR